MPGMLDKDELKRRIDALRTLRGMTQVDLAELFAAKGHGSQELGRLERGALQLTEIRRRSLAEILEVPEHWFVDEHLDLTSQPGSDIRTQLDAIQRRVEANGEALEVLLGGLANGGVAEEPALERALGALVDLRQHFEAQRRSA